MHPIRFVKAHPIATLALFAGGMVFGPAVTGALARTTGVGVNLPTVGG